MTIRDVLQSAFASLFDEEAKMNKIYEQMGDPEMADKMDQMLEETATIQDYLNMHDFYMIDAKVDEVARAFGLVDLGLDKDVTELSGGQRTKINALKQKRLKVSLQKL